MRRFTGYGCKVPKVLIDRPATVLGPSLRKPGWRVVQFVGHHPGDVRRATVPPEMLGGKLPEPGSSAGTA